MKKYIFIGMGLLAAFVTFAFDFNSLNPDKISKVVGNSKKAAQGITGISLKEEQSIGGSVAVEIVAHYGGLVRDEAMTKRVNFIGKSLAYYSARPELTYRFGILNSDTVNAFSAPGGYIFITRGLYNLMENDDELAGALAHEIAHVTERHALNIIRRQDLVEGGVGLAGQFGGNAGKQAEMAYSSNIGKIANTILQTGFSQPQEYAADQKGSQLATTVGYAPDGLKNCLEALQKRGSSGGTTIFPTHPPLKERIAKLE
ncbi:MAG: M48 family metalloprotease [Limisphaerales bacterium]